MKLNLNSLKKNLHNFAGECNLTAKEIGELADKSASINDFKNALDELCLKNINKTTSEVLSEFGMRFPGSNTSTKPTPTENSPLQNELIEANGKIDKLEERDKTPRT